SRAAETVELEQQLAFQERDEALRLGIVGRADVVPSRVGNEDLSRHFPLRPSCRCNPRERIEPRKFARQRRELSLAARLIVARYGDAKRAAESRLHDAPTCRLCRRGGA